ncbi:hypothetical protein WJX74_000782 [Apatococcus lobatus]|uniref:Uncharacterized protein n=1 Tax=Apatococcus lobatus TaxID=904363 RepID=A0AAW1Q9B3_9CHLO
MVLKRAFRTPSRASAPQAKVNAPPAAPPSEEATAQVDEQTVGQQPAAGLAQKPKRMSNLPYVPRLPAVLSSTLPSVIRLGRGASIPDLLLLIGRLPVQKMPEVEQELLSPAKRQSMHCIMMPAFEESQMQPPHPMRTDGDEDWATDLLSRLDVMLGNLSTGTSSKLCSGRSSLSGSQEPRHKASGNENHPAEAPSDLLSEDLCFDELEDIWASPEKQQQAISQAYRAGAVLSKNLLQQAFAC